MTGTDVPRGGFDSRPKPEDFQSYHLFLQAVRLYKGMRPIDVCNASITPEFPGSKIKAAALSRMESGGAKNPSFRQMIRYARGYGVSLEELAHFFHGEDESVDSPHSGQQAPA